MSKIHLNLVKEAITNMNTYKKPNILEADTFLKRLIKAAGLAIQDKDILECLDIEEDMLYVTYSWTSRGCVQSETHALPLNLVLAENPENAAETWGKEVKLQDLLNKKNVKQKELEQLEQLISQLI